MVDFTSYVPPGVYVSDTSTPIVTPSGPPGSLVTIVGPGSGFQTYTEVVAAHSLVSAATILTHRGVFTTAVTGPPAIGAPVVKTLGGTLLTYNSDYTFSIDTSQGGGSANAVTKIVRLASGIDPTNVTIPSPAGVVDGDLLVITYNYADSAYYVPLIFDNFDSVVSVYGDPWTVTSSAVNSRLSLAAKVAFENGAAQVMLVATNPADGNYQAQLLAAYNKLLADFRVGIIVPLLVDALVTGGNTSDTHTVSAVESLLTDIKTHCEASAAVGFGRISIVGLSRNYDSITLGFDGLAQFVNSKRVVLPFPNLVNLYNSTANQTIQVSGYYVAAAMAGVLSAGNVDRGLTKKTLNSFVGIPSSTFQVMTRSYKDTLSSSGVCVAEVDRNSNLSIRHGVTTNVSNLLSREISMVRISDALYEAVQAGMDNAGLIGEPIDIEMPTRVKGALVGVLEQSITNQIILAYRNLAVRQQSLPSGDPTVIECKFDYQPAVPLNYITVAFKIDLTSGLTQFQDTTLGASGSTTATT